MIIMDTMRSFYKLYNILFNKYIYRQYISYTRIISNDIRQNQVVLFGSISSVILMEYGTSCIVVSLRKRPRRTITSLTKFCLYAIHLK